MATTTIARNPRRCSGSISDSSSHFTSASDQKTGSLSDEERKKLSSFPSRQRRKGLAPLASFEDLSVGYTTSESSSPEERTLMPDIGEENSGATTPVTPVKKIATLSVCTSPKIRVSAASSSSPAESKESTPEKELRKSGFFEDMATELHSSTEELDADDEDRARRRRDTACRLAEIERRERREEELKRKGSSSSMLSDGLLPITSGHSSRLSSLGSIGSVRRSPSPHKMLLETSFCGPKPMTQPSIDLEDTPVTGILTNYTIDKMDVIKSPMDARPPDIFRSSPTPTPSPSPRLHSDSNKVDNQRLDKQNVDTQNANIQRDNIQKLDKQNIDAENVNTHKKNNKEVKRLDRQFINEIERVESRKVQSQKLENNKLENRKIENQNTESDKSEIKKSEPKKIKPAKPPRDPNTRKSYQEDLSISKLKQEQAPIHKPSINQQDRQVVKKSEREYQHSQHLETGHDQERRPLSSPKEGHSPRSPRNPKKVDIPTVPNVPDLNLKSRASSSTIAAAASTTTTPEYQFAQSTFTTTPTASPVISRRARKRRDDNIDSETSSPSVSRKSSFTNLFRRNEAVLSPVTPDSPGSSSGRKSPFSTFLKSAKKEFRSRSRSRSRSKSRDRDLDDDTHDRRGVFSIFKPNKKNKGESDNDDPGNSNAEGMDVHEDLTKVDFKFNDEGIYQPSGFGMIRQESEISKAINNPVHSGPGDKDITDQVQEATLSSRDSSSHELSMYMNNSEPKVPINKQLIKESKFSENNDKVEIENHEVMEEPVIQVQQSVQYSEKETDKTAKPDLPSKQKERTSGADLEIDNSNLDALSVDMDSADESERHSEVDYRKSKEKFKNNEGELASPSVENKGLVSHDSFEEELPYVPTTLPIELPLGAPIVPIRERVHALLRTTQSIDRPRITIPKMPGKLDEIIDQEVVMSPDSDNDKMKINISGGVRVLPTIRQNPQKKQLKQSSQSWEEFAQEGLRSPRQLRKEYNQSREGSLDGPPPAPPPPPPPRRTPYNPPKPGFIPPAPPQPGKNWINFEDVPEVVVKPARQIKTVPPRHVSHTKQQAQRHHQLQQQQQQQQLQEELMNTLRARSRHQEERRIETEERENLVKETEEPWQHQEVHRKQENIRQHKKQQQFQQRSIQKPQEMRPPETQQPQRQQPQPLSLNNRDPGSESCSAASSPDKEHSSEHSSDSDIKRSSPSSGEDLTTVRERLAEMKKDDDGDSDLERLLAPVNDCINRLSSLTCMHSEPPSTNRSHSPIPDNWADFLLPPQPGRRSRLSSIGSDAGSIASIGSLRSPSPSMMLLETSFCGSTPIDDPGQIESSIPMNVVRKYSGISLGDLSSFRDSRGSDRMSLSRQSLTSPNPERASMLSSQRINSVSSLPCMATTEQLPPDRPSMRDRSSPIPDNWAENLLPPQPGRRSRLNSIGSDAGSITGRLRSPSPMLLETSFCGANPIDDPAAIEADIPLSVIRKLSAASIGDLSFFSRGDPNRMSLGRQSRASPSSDRISILSDSSAEGASTPYIDLYNQQTKSSSTKNAVSEVGVSGPAPGVHGQLNPFDVDLGIRSNRSSLISQEHSPPGSPAYSYHPS